MTSMTRQPALYEVWFSVGEGFHRGPAFRLLADAERYVVQHLGEASFALRRPDGHWEIVARNAYASQGP
ncbi:MAG: hypothetical protein H6709_09370 [Kofleriaceae bacterium]|nr:hypothetical protein [Myxococcales bacterium]MCB9561562.1 hypothetical protein [Kofleriaceae bacterium]MCB9572280.1 hypothetical protein [Kofleriaceae bacterium]